MSLAIALMLIVSQLVALPQAVQELTFPALDAREYVGRNVTLEGTVVATRVSSRGTIYLDFEQRAPHQAISAVIYPAAAGRFPGLTGFIGKRALISGLVTRTARGIEMILDAPGQIRLAPEPKRAPC